MMFKLIRRLNRSITPEGVRSDLNTLLNSLGPTQAFEDRMSALMGLMDWMRQPISTASNEVIEGVPARNLRFKFLFQMLERHPELGQNFLHTFKEVTGKGRAVRLYCLTGITENTGFFVELMDRVVQKLLPPIHLEKDLAELFKLLFTEEEDAKWLELSPQEVVAPFLEFLKKNDVSTNELSNDQTDALIILGSQVSALGISKHIRRHLNYQHISETSFFKLSMAINRGETDEAVLRELENCRRSLAEVRLGLEHSGVSVNLIHLLERIDALLNRIEMLLYLRHTEDERARVYIISNFLGRIIRDELTVLGVKDFIYQNLHMLTRKIVERTADKGDTYIAHNKDEQLGLFVAASWAGGLTAFTAVVKFGIGRGSFPLFFEGLFYFINYALGFLLMQKWHLALSSKQPAYTASSLSKKFESFLRTKQLSEVILEVRKIMSSQLITAWANLLWVVPITFLLDAIWFFSTGEHMMKFETAMEVLDKHRLGGSFSILYAAFTGVLLWLSSIIAGWTENWMVFRGIPHLLMESKGLKRTLGGPRLKSFAEKFPSRMAGVAGNVSIAFFLATPVIIGKITGLPLDIRHVTLAAGTVTLGLSSLEWSFSHWPIYLEMLLSVTVIGLLNFGVSFYCAIRMAAMAREVNARYLKIIFKFALRKPRPKSSESGP